MLAGTSIDIDRELAVVTDELAKRLEGEVPRPLVEEAVEKARAEFGEPPITQFLPVLIMRRVRDQLVGAK